MKKYFFLILITVLSIGCSNTPGRSVDRRGEIKTDVVVAQSKRYHETTGIGAPSDNAKNKAARMQTSYEAAKALAYREMAEYIYGVQLEGGTTVRDAMAVDSTVQTQVTAFIRGAQVVRKEWIDDDSCIVTMRINMDDFKERLAKLGFE